MKFRRYVDWLMFALIPTIFAYAITGNFWHEAFGIALCTVFALHNIQNISWYKSIFKCKFFRITLGTAAINFLLATDILLVAITGILLSRDIFTFINYNASVEIRTIHSTCAVWLIPLCGTHIGFHLKQKKFSQIKREKCFAQRRVLFSIFLIAVGTIYFLKTKLFYKLIAYYSFDEWSFDKNILDFYIAYPSIVLMFASITFLIRLIVNFNKLR